MLLHDFSFTPAAELLAGLLDQDVEEVVVAHLEDLGEDPHAHGVALAQIEVDDDSHRCPPRKVATAEPTAAASSDTNAARTRAI